jgi:hypothetical protein
MSPASYATVATKRHSPNEILPAAKMQGTVAILMTQKKQMHKRGTAVTLKEAKGGKCSTLENSISHLHLSRIRDSTRDDIPHFGG